MESAINNNMCRCCASEGTFKDVKSTYQWMGETEVYSDMLRDCFDISLHQTEVGEYSGICEVCITQLRNAFNFKKQVQLTEEQFKNRLSDTMLRSNVKIEMSRDEDVLESDNDNNLSEDFGPEVPIKTENAQDIAKPRKRAAKATTSRAKKPKTEDGETSKRVSGTDEKQKRRVTKASLKRARRCLKLERQAQKKNLITILLNSNANPINFKDMLGIHCAYCPLKLQRSEDLKAHFVAEHRDRKFIEAKLKMFAKNVVKLDITNLICEICNQRIDSLENILVHFKSEHQLNVEPDVDNVVLPFQFDGNELHCVYCSSSYSLFKVLREHMNTHFRKFVCDVCDSGYVSSELLYRHKLRHAVSKSTCPLCNKVFDSKGRLRRHEQTVHLGVKKNKCNYCDARFEEFNQKLKHIQRVHRKNLGVTCSICDKEFVTPRDLRVHVKQFHLLENEFECQLCDKKFFTKAQLKSHLVVHSGEQLYQCGDCLKVFPRMGTLQQHMKRHENAMKLDCNFCRKIFYKKIDLKRHLFNIHGDLFK